MTIGIYGIYYSDECLYIGQSINIEERTKTHLRHLKNYNHNLKEFNEYCKIVGIENLSIRIIEIVDNIDHLSEKEYYYWSQFKPKFFGCTPPKNTIYSNYRLPKFDEKNCEYCGEKFRINNCRQKYCNVQCKRKDRSKEHTCQYCQKIYWSTNKDSTFCSQKCFYALRNFNCTCTVCQNIFSSSKREAKICSKKCQIIHQNTHHNCMQCGEDFIAFRRKNVKFCSKECRKIERKTFTLKCVKCNKKFSSSKSFAMYCSECPKYNLVGEKI